MKIVLSARLKVIADMVGQCTTVADIGTDHAFLPIYLVQNQRCEKVYAADIAPGPLERAKEYIKEYLGESGQIIPVLSDGVKNVPEICDVTVIAGMGGDNICQILQSVSDAYRGKLVLQPMTSSEELRRWLYRTGWRVTEETVVEDGGFLYSVMCAERGRDICAAYEAFFSKPLMQKRDELTKKYLLKQIARLQGVVDGRKRSERGLSSKEEQEILNELRRIYDEQYGR